MSFDIFSDQKKPAIKILGASGGKSNTTALTSLQVSKTCVIDAGNLIHGMEENVEKIEHIFLSHVHLDHIVDIPFFLDNIYEKQKKPIKIYSHIGNIRHLQKHILNGDIWPDFSVIPMLNSKEYCIEFIPVDYNLPIEIDSIKITPIQNNHTSYSSGFIIKKEDSSLLFTSDTYCCDSIWDTINNDSSITTVIIDVSFPSNLHKLARNSKHLTPELLEGELKKLQRDNITIHINHLKPTYEEKIIEEIMEKKLLYNGGSILKHSDTVYF